MEYTASFAKQLHWKVVSSTALVQIKIINTNQNFNTLVLKANDLCILFYLESISLDYDLQDTSYIMKYYLVTASARSEN